MKTFGGLVQFLDRSDINTDEIIPAKYLTEVTKESLKPYLLEDLKLAGFDRKSTVFTNARVVVTRENFGCGSSREHAPWALEVNGITTVIAQSYARIFRQNMFNCGMLAIELSEKAIDELFAHRGADALISIDFDNDKLTMTSSRSSKTFDYQIAEFDKALVKAGGWVEFADLKY